jgi:hypothetical protein
VRKPALGSEAPTPSKLVRRADDAHGGVGQGGDVELIRERRSKTDHLLDGVGLARREHLGEDSAAAVADEADARAGLFADLDKARAQSRHQVLRVLNVELDPGEVRLVADALQPVVEDAQRPVAREEAGDEEDRPPVTAANPSAAQHRIAQQRGHLAQGKRVPELHCLGW